MSAAVRATNRGPVAEPDGEAVADAGGPLDRGLRYGADEDRDGAR